MRLGRLVFAGQAINHVAGGLDFLHRPDALAAAPDIAPGLGLLVAAGPEVHLRRIALRQVFRIEAGPHDGGAQIVAVHPGEEVGVEDVVAGRLHDHLLVALLGIGFLRGDEGRADIGEVGAHGLGAPDSGAVGDGAGQGHRPVEPGADVLDQGEGGQGAGMAPGPGRDRDQAVGAFFDRLAGEAVGDHVMQGDAAVGMDGRVQVLAGAQGGDDHRRLPFHTKLEIFFEAVVGLVDDLIDRIGRRRRIRMVAVPGRQLLGNPVQPFVQHGDRPGVQGRERADDAGLALGDHQLGSRDDE